MRGRRLAAALITLTLVTGCGDDDARALDSQPFVAVDGSPRLADDAGRLDAVADDFSTLTVDGRTYEIHPALQSFAAADGTTQPLLRWIDQYVHVGLDGDVVQWISGISAVVAVSDQPDVAFFTDVLVEVDGGDLVFRSGTVLAAAEDVAAPADPPVAVVATIDVGSDQVVGLDPA